MFGPVVDMHAVGSCLVKRHTGVGHQRGFGPQVHRSRAAIDTIAHNVQAMARPGRGRATTWFTAGTGERKTLFARAHSYRPLAR